MLAPRRVRMTKVQEPIVYSMAYLVKEGNLQQQRINSLLIQCKILTFRQIIIAHLQSVKT